MDNEKVKIELVNGCEGKSIYVDDYRVVGSKPWGGGRTEKDWIIDKKKFLKSLNRALGLKKIMIEIIEEEKARDIHKSKRDCYCAGIEDCYCEGVDTGFDDAITAIERYFDN
jgi:hypothetical protein